jgi:predicted enzyme related to lactoylglutathione lyase
VQSVDASLDDVTASEEGGAQKTAVPKFGYLAMCKDTEGNTFGLWEEDSGAE